MSLTRTAALAAALVQRPSLTPEDRGCMELVARELGECGFSLIRHSPGLCSNLIALHGSGTPFLLFVGHTDVVPPGELKDWDFPPFGAEIRRLDGEDCLTGRGTADMKGADAAMTVALAEYVSSHPDHAGTVGLLLTSNEEGDGKGGIRDVAPWLKDQGLTPTYCIVGEPSSERVFGDTFKAGRRGSLSILVTVHGRQGHVAYPGRVLNPLHAAARLIEALNEPLDEGTDDFPPTSFQVTNFHGGTGAENVVPGSCEFLCNYRFNPLHSRESLEAHVQGLCQRLGIEASLNFRLNGLPFVTAGGPLREALSNAIEEVTGQKPVPSTAGGTSDGRFIAPLGVDVVEFGPLSGTIHQINEHVSLSSLEALREIYVKVMERLIG